MGREFSQGLQARNRNSLIRSSELISQQAGTSLDCCDQSAGAVIVVSQDITYYKMSTLQALEGLGFIQGKVKGTIQYNVLACDSGGLPLGLLYQRN